MPILNSMPNYVRYDDNILELIDSYPEYKAQERKQIRSCLIAIWEPIPEGTTFNSNKMFNAHNDILENVKIRKAILSIISQSSSVNDKTLKEIASTNTERQQTELILNTHDMVLFMNRIINVLQTKTLFFSQETQKESCGFLIQLAYKLEEGLNIISSSLYNNQIKNYNFFIDIQNSLLDQAQQFLYNTSNIIANQNLQSEEKTSLINLLINTNKWHIYEAKCFFALGEDEQAYKMLGKINPKLPDFFKEKTDIITEIQNNATRKIYIEIIETLNEKNRAPSENKNEVSLEQITNENLKSILNEFSEKILNSTTLDENITLEAVKLLRLVQTQKKANVEDLKLCKKLYQKLIGLAALNPEYRALKNTIIKGLIFENTRLQSKIKFFEIMDEVSTLSISTSSKQPVPAQDNKKKKNKTKAILDNINSATATSETKKSEPTNAAAQTASAIEKVEKQETNTTITIEDADNSQEKQAKKTEARRLTKELRRGPREKEATIDQKDNKPEAQLSSAIKNDSTKTLQTEKALEKKAKKQQASEERSRKQKEQAFLVKQKLEEEVKKQKEEDLLKKQASEERKKKKAEKKEERKKKKEAQTQNQSIELEQVEQEKIDKPVATLAITQNPKKENQQERPRENKPQQNIATSSKKEDQATAITTSSTPIAVAAASSSYTEKAKSTSNVAVILPAPQHLKKKDPIILKQEDFPPLSRSLTIDVTTRKNIVNPTNALTSEKPSEKELKEKQAQTTNSTEDLQEKIRSLELENSGLKIKEASAAKTLQALRDTIAILDKNNNSNLLEYTKADLQRTHDAMLHNYACAMQKQSELEALRQEYTNSTQNMQAALAQTYNTMHNMQRENELNILDTMYWKQESEKNASQAAYWQEVYIKSEAYFNRRIPLQQYTPVYIQENKSERDNLASSSVVSTSVKKKYKTSSRAASLRRN